MIYQKDKLLIIAGPCSLESKDISFRAAEAIVAVQKKYPELTVLFSGSFDKANRTSSTSARGTGMDEGLGILAAVKKQFNLPVITDIHLPQQAAIVAQVCDALQIPAFLCRQTDLLVASAATGRAINIKKGQFLSPYDMVHAVKKLHSSGAKEIWQCERGTTFGYNNLVVDMRGFSIMKSHGFPVILDATHSVQLPGAANGASGGERQHIAPLALAAIAAGADGLYIETHPTPEKAISDAQCQLPLNDFEKLVTECLAMWKLRRSFK